MLLWVVVAIKVFILQNYKSIKQIASMRFDSVLSNDRDPTAFHRHTLLHIYKYLYVCTIVGWMEEGGGNFESQELIGILSRALLCVCVHLRIKFFVSDDDDVLWVCVWNFSLENFNYAKIKRKRRKKLKKSIN